VLGVVVVSLFAAMLARLWYLQVLAAPAYRVEAQHNRVRLVETEAPRGRILDRAGRPLVDNRVSEAVVVTRAVARRHPGVLDRLGTLLGMPAADLEKRLADQRFSPFKPVPVAVDVPKETLIAIRERQASFPGVNVVALTQRNYPQGALAAHVLGYVGPVSDKDLVGRKAKGYSPGDSIGKSGVELSYEDDLRGQPLLEKVEVDSRGQVLKTLGQRPAQPGHDVQLTIDLDAQRLAEESLAEGLKAAQQSTERDTGRHFTAPGGSAVVLDPRDGSVLAVASLPTYDPVQFVNGISETRFRQLQDPAGHFPLIDRAIQGLYAPGSTFKLVTSLAGLERGVITPNTTVNDTGSIKIGPQIFHNALGRSYGPVNLAKALTVSSDVYFYTLGANLWIQKSRYGLAIQDAARRLGLGTPSGIELPFEAAGRVPESRKRLHETNPKAFPNGGWFTGDNVQLAIGQGELVVTPLQLANAYATFANGGTLYAPHLGAAIFDSRGDKLHDVIPRALRRLPLPVGVHDPILKGLEGVTADPKGTAFGAFSGFPLSTFPVAGKTGTAQVFGQQDTAVFAAFGPVSSPRYAVAVVLEQSGLGADAAAPVVRRILEGVDGQAPRPVSVAPSSGVD